MTDVASDKPCRSPPSLPPPSGTSPAFLGRGGEVSGVSPSPPPRNPNLPPLFYARAWKGQCLDRYAVCRQTFFSWGRLGTSANRARFRRTGGGGVPGSSWGEAGVGGGRRERRWSRSVGPSALKAHSPLRPPSLFQHLRLADSSLERYSDSILSQSPTFPQYFKDWRSRSASLSHPPPADSKGNLSLFSLSTPPSVLPQPPPPRRRLVHNCRLLLLVSRD